MRDEYDIRGGVRGKYYERHQQGTNVVLLASDVAAVFHDSESVNRALRMLIEVARGSEPAGVTSNPPLEPTGLRPPAFRNHPAPAAQRPR